LAAAGYATDVTITSEDADEVAPRLTAFSISPRSVDIRSGTATVDFNVGAEDAGVGVFDVRVRLLSPSGVQRAAVARAPDSGTLNAGTWIVTVSIPGGSEPGEYRVGAVEMWDRVGNVRILSEAELTAAGFPTKVSVISSDAG
ncbi:MAG TPA: hypothetical protein VHG09_07035, partial [Longimicrobiales bacterium]|nr:hypothetical protein [Longimicrobiales bacterium]